MKILVVDDEETLCEALRFNLEAEEMNARLQVVNERILQRMERGEFNAAGFATGEFDDLRISVINADGNVIYDNSLDALPNTNHLQREEIATARQLGAGYTLRRHSESTGLTYFYSARRGRDGIIVRTAVPYTISLRALLEADRGFLWFLGALTLIMCTLGYFATRRAGHDAALHEQQAKERIKKRLTNNINHELKTPVASMRVCLETLMAHPDMSADKRMEFLRRCFANNQRLQQLLTDVSLITRMDDGAHTITKERLDLAEIISTVVDEKSAAAESKGFAIQNDVFGPIAIEGNKALLESVFYNLTDNALSYSGGNRVEITKMPAEGGKAVIIFSDNGAGVALEHLPRLFERFYRVDKGRSRAAGGTGLGLSIVKNAVQLHGGTISVSNGPRGGLTFKIILPARKIS